MVTAIATTRRSRIHGFAVALVTGWAATGAAQAPYVEGAEVVEVDSLRVPLAPYVGNDVYRSCHAGAYEAWLGTAHARSWVFLATGAADSVAARMEPPVADPLRSARCLSCHGTAADVAGRYRADGFRMQEGVQCEGCHGPGGLHVKKGLVVAGAALRGSRMAMPDEAACRACHKERPSHEWMQRPPFHYERGEKRIAHPIEGQERWALMKSQPGGYLSISLRTVLGHLFGG